MTPSEHEQRSCRSKVRHPQKPDVKGDYFTAYECRYCGGWHLATNSVRSRGDVKYTAEGWPIVPVN